MEFIDKINAKIVWLRIEHKKNHTIYKSIENRKEDMPLKFVITNKHKMIILVLIIVLFHLIKTICWLNVNDMPLGKDTYSHLYQLSDMIKIAQARNIAMLVDNGHSFLYKFIFARPNYPPFYFFVGVLLEIFLGWISARVILLTSSVFFVFLIIFTFKISELAIKGSGILSVFLISFCPIIYHSMRQFNLELAVCAMVTASFYFYLKCNNFREKNFSIFFGISLGLGMLTRQTFIVFLIAILFLEILRTVLCKELQDRKRVINIVLAFLVALLITSSYYHNRQFLNHSADVLVNVNFYSGKSFFQMSQFYFDITKHYLPSPFFVGLFFTACIFLAFLKSSSKHIFFVWAFSPFLVIPVFFKAAFLISRFVGMEPTGFFQDHRYPLEVSYILPVLPAFVLLISIAVNKISKKIIRYSLALIIILAAVFSYDNSSPHIMFFASGEEKEDFIETFSEIGNHKYKIGILALGTEEYLIDIYTHIGARFLLDSKNLPEIIDFFSCPTEFFNQLEEIDVMIICSKSLKGWPSEEELLENLERMFEKRKIKFSISNEVDFIRFEGKEIVVPEFFPLRLSELKTLFRLENTLQWYLDYKPVPTAFYIYKREELLSSS